MTTVLSDLWLVFLGAALSGVVALYFLVRWRQAAADLKAATARAERLACERDAKQAELDRLQTSIDGAATYVPAVRVTHRTFPSPLGPRARR